MNVFFIGDRKLANLKKINGTIIDFLESEGNKVDKSLINSSLNSEINNIEESYKRNINSINSCDVLIAETTNVSSGIGFLIAMALSAKKPVLSLFNREIGGQPSVTLQGTANKSFVFKEFSDDKELKIEISNFLKDAKQKLDTKFILIIPAEIDRYLEWASVEKRMHKAQIVREAIEKVMDGDKEWREYQKNV